jgi:predicted Fe-Mo cluster-binding NifX family protein
MKIAISSMGTDLNAQVDPRFGRCQYFIIVDPDTMEFEAVENPNINAMGGAGIQSGQMMAEKGVQAILTGNVGPNAFQTLSAAGVQVITGVTGKVKDVIQQFKSGQLQSVSEATVPNHFGIGGGGVPGAGMGRGMGMGGGMGRGMGMGGGMGRGMGMGGGMGRGMGRWGSMGPGMQPMPASQAGFPPQQQMTKEQELQMLKEHAEAMKQQLDQIVNRIKDLEEK